MLIKGENLTEAQKGEVLNAYGYRWTIENQKRAALRSFHIQKNLPKDMLISDWQWIKDHAFYITQKGHLDARRRHCEPAFMVEE